MKITLRPSANNDTDFLREVYNRAYHDVIIAQFKVWDEDRQEKYFLSLLDKSGLQVVLCDRVPCGLFLCKRRKTEIFVHEILLLPEFQRKGIGTLLLKDIMANAQRQGIPIKLRVLHKNRAFKLYSRLGFKETGKTATHSEMKYEPS